jgi:hypothetical protein
MLTYDMLVNIDLYKNMKIKNLYEFTTNEAEKKLKEYLSKETDRDIEVKILDSNFDSYSPPITGTVPYTGENVYTTNVSSSQQEYWEVKEVNKKTSDILDECRSKFKVYSYYNNEKLDEMFPIPKMTTRKFKANIEADEDLKNMSANELEKAGIEGITLRERLLLELQYFNKTGGHLGVENWTLCSGSRYSDGSVPSVRWDSSYDLLYVDWSAPDVSNDYLRSRAVVS